MDEGTPMDIDPTPGSNGQTQMQQVQSPGPAANTTGFPGGWRDGAKGPTSQQMLSRQRPEDQDETDMGMSVDGDTIDIYRSMEDTVIPAGPRDQQVSAIGTLLATGSSSVSVDRTATQTQNHSDEPKNATKPEGFRSNEMAPAITQQPLKGPSAPCSSQHLGHQPSGDTSATYTSQPSRDTWGQTQMQQVQSPGPAANLIGFSGGRYDGAKDPTSQQMFPRQRSQDQDETKPSEDEMQNQQLSEPQDVAAVLVEIEWEGKKQPPKWEMMLYKTLQSFFNTNFKGTEQRIEVCNLYKLDAPFLAKIVISPSSACEMLLNMKSTLLKFKDMNENATVYFRQKVSVDKPPVSADEPPVSVDEPPVFLQIPMTVSAVVDVQKFEIQLEKKLLHKFAQHKTGSHTLTVKGTFEEVEEFYKEFKEVIGQPVSRNTNSVSIHTHPNQMETSREPMRVPLFQYWYLNQMQRKEIEQIEEKHGVTIKADVCVTVETSGATNESSTDATDEFIDLFRKCANNSSVNVPVPSAALELVQRFDDKLMLTVSAQNCILLGPPDYLDAAQRLLNQPANKDDPRSERPEVHWDKDRNKNPHGESRWNGPKTIEMNIKDPLLSNGLCISDTHWELMKNAFKKQIKDLKNKFGVDFGDDKKTFGVSGNVTVSAQSTGIQIVNLEVNALRALMSLYQKVVTTTMSCPLQNTSHTQTESVKVHLSAIRKQNPSLAVVEGSGTGGAWMMIGLPDHLRFAVKEIEKKLDGTVFDKKHKDMLGYEQDAEFLTPYGNESAWEGERGASRSSMDGATSSNVYGENQWEKGGKGYAASGSSVNGATSSSVYGENQKPGGAGRKETNAYEWRKGEGSTGGPNNDHRAPPGGKDGGGEEDKCPICMDDFNNEEKLSCGHSFCKDCLRRSVESMGATCPVCKDVFGKVEGDQPDGTMNDRSERPSVPGFGGCGTIIIDYNIPSGNQSSKHPKPGRTFQGARRTAYLPDNKEGREILALLKRAFDQRLIFTVGTSRTSGQDDCVTWNDIHHKTSIYGGPQRFGYPDDDYMKRVREELKAKGIE